VPSSARPRCRSRRPIGTATGKPDRGITTEPIRPSPSAVPLATRAARPFQSSSAPWVRYLVQRDEWRGEQEPESGGTVAPGVRGGEDAVADRVADRRPDDVAQRFPIGHRSPGGVAEAEYGAGRGESASRERHAAP
jgi:hypothetical protein